MTSNMTESQNIFEEDRISNLPGKLIECIMEFMPVRDAARTCVLSNKWRYVWAKRPSLVLDMDFWDDIKLNRSPNKLEIDYANIVSSILQYHVGHIRKFVIDVSVLSCHIDLWLSSLFRRGLKELGLENSNNGNENRYEVPCLVFSTSTLTHLSFSGCLIKAEDPAAGCFTNIQSLILDDVILPSVALTIPLLTSLTLERCSGSRDFDVSAPRLASLTLDDNDYLNLKPFLMCSGINYVYLFSTDETEYVEDYANLNLVKLLAAWPRISELIVDGLCFKYLATGSIPSTLELNLRYFSLCNLNLDLELIPWILCILKNSPLMHTFEIWFAATDLEEVNDIDEARLVDTRIDQLPIVMMKDFTASRNKVMFAKILLRSISVLGRMFVEENDELDHEERIKILKKLLLLQRAFPKAEIIFGPNIVPL